MKTAGADGERGFTLVELLVVVAIIALLAAVSVPSISTYVRNYQIRGAGQQVEGELIAARAKALAKNVNLGADFVILSPTTYRWVIEDDMDPETAPNWTIIRSLADWTELTGDLAAIQAGLLKTLPSGVEFAACATNPPTGFGVRFNRLGGVDCIMGSGATACPLPANPPAPTFLVSGVSGGAEVCVWQRTTNLRRRIMVASGGRVRVEQ